MMLEDAHLFQGIRRATHPIKLDKLFLWDAHNIRLTTRDGETMLSITNERSTKFLFSFESDEKYIGHVVVGKFLVVLIKGVIDRIYRVDLESMKKVLLCQGNFGFNTSYPALMISDYESELILKVYWVDGKNSPRVLNIMKPKLLGIEDEDRTDYTGIYEDAPFNFVLDLELNETVTIERLQSSVGIFPSGVIQYAMTYFHKYGQESNIFYVSEPLYLSYADRGGSPEDKISTSFRISINNIDSKFGYVRVYSILRTSLDSLPVVKRVSDIDISKSIESGVSTISIVDNNTTGDIIDPTYLLYVGGKDIIAKCIALKDNVLFLGGITYKRQSVYDLDIRDSNLRLYPAPELSIANRSIPLVALDVDYMYANQLSKNTLTFKRGETYRLGCRFQYKTGEWSEPVWVSDYEYNYNNLWYNGSTLNLGKIVGTLPNKIKETLILNGYKKVLALISLPSYKDRTIIALGILCPTVGNVGNRVQGGGAWALSSWLLRPWALFIMGDGYNGAVPAYLHDMSLPFGSDRAVELQNMAIMNTEGEALYQLSYKEMAEALNDAGASEGYYGAFVVDLSIVTMHSPDIEFGDIINLLSSEVDLELYKVGEVRFNNNIGEIDILTSTPVADPDASGFIKRSLSGDGTRSLISGLFYEDAMVDDSDGGKKIGRYMASRLWMTYMWHRIGSLNNDCVRPEGTGTRTSELKKKSITNLKVSNSTTFGSLQKLPLLDIKSFNSNEVALTRLKRVDNNGAIKSASYYGNIDTLVPAYLLYSFMCTANAVAELKNGNVTLNGVALTGGELKTFNNLSIKDAKGSNTFIQSNNISAGLMPYIVDTTTTITNTTNTSTNTNTSTSATGGSSSGEGEGSEGSDSTSNSDSSSSTDSDSNTTITSSGTKTVQVNVAGKVLVMINISNGEFSGTVTLTLDAVATDGKTTVPSGYSWSVSGKTTYQPSVKKHAHTWFGTGHKHPRWSDVTPLFTSATQSLDLGSGEGGGILGAGDVGDNYEALKLSKDGIRMRYKSTPHAVISLESPLTALSQSGSLYLVELRLNPGSIRYGGDTEEALKNNIWIPAGPPMNINDSTIEWVWGDTWFLRYDCLKTYPFTFEDLNQVTEIGSFYCETRVNIDGRYDRNRGSASFSLSPTNFNLINPVYSQLDTFFNTRMLDDDYYKVKEFPSLFLWTGVKSPSSDTDTWTNLHMANSYDMDGVSGSLTAILVFNDLLIGFQERAISLILFNSRVQILASDGVPIEIANNLKVEGVRAYSNVVGCQDKYNIINTATGIYFIDNNNSTVYLFNGQLNNIGLLLGSLYWFRDNYLNNTWMFKSDKEGNPGVRLFYDPKYLDIYFIPSMTKYNSPILESNLALCFSELLNQFTSMLSYNGAVMFSFESKLYSLANNTEGVLTLWENFAGDGYNNIYNVFRPFNFSFISNENPTITKIFDSIEMRTDRYDGETLVGNKYTINTLEGLPLDFIRVNNEYQDTSNVDFNASSLRKKFRIWRALIPRNNGTRERIRNTWSKITLGCKEPSNNMTILHDLSVKYTV